MTEPLRRILDLIDQHQLPITRYLAWHGHLGVDIGVETDEEFEVWRAFLGSSELPPLDGRRRVAGARDGVVFEVLSGQPAAVQP